ncbi:MAG TPA: MoaD/ThiS family protein [Planctomycetota bacterium]|nr:MoaD/ThiS family protein [Planctomycetota bacterium]
MRVRALLFASLRERAGAGEIDLELPAGSSVDAARDALEARHPGLFAGPVATAVNGAHVRGAGARLREGDEIAFLPPVSGG